MQIAQLWHQEDGAARCGLCAHRCLIKDGKTGICGVRKNIGGELHALTYGMVAAEAVDPIEKKPLFHYLPGTLSYSLGGVGCNFHCRHCQNWHISEAGPDDGNLRPLTPEDAVERSISAGCRSISWTYNEPTIWHEYAMDMGHLARKKDLGTVYVTNGYMTEEALVEIAGMLEAFRVDIKAFSDSFYREICGARLEPVLDAALLAHELGLHIETVTLVIPGLNDSVEETDALIRWVVDNLGPDTPMHFTRFHPDYRMTDIPPTPVATLERIYRRARELGLRYPYLGNVFGHPYESTYCPACNALLIERSGFGMKFRALDNGRCGACGEPIAIRTVT